MKNFSFLLPSFRAAKNYFIYVIIIAQMFTFCYIYLQFIF